MNQQIIERAIKDKCLVEFNYSGHPRKAEPHILGKSGDALQFLGYQVGGSSSSGGSLPEWRRFDLGKITGLAVSTQKFAGPRPYPSGKHSSWDQKILVVEA